MDRAGACKGVVQHTCQALPHNLSRNWKLAKQSAYANTASRHLCLEAELLCDYSRGQNQFFLPTPFGLIALDSLGPFTARS